MRFWFRCSYFYSVLCLYYIIYYFCRVFPLLLHLSREFLNKVKNILLSPVVNTPTKNPVTLEAPMGKTGNTGNTGNTENARYTRNTRKPRIGTDVTSSQVLSTST